MSDGVKNKPKSETLNQPWRPRPPGQLHFVLVAHGSGLVPVKEPKIRADEWLLPLSD
jgi:hypothetical protein